jgi:hypothetical protein
MDTPLDDIEKATWEYICKEFSLEILSITDNFIVFGNILDALIHTQPILESSSYIDKLQEAEKHCKCKGVSTLLLLESFERLYSARLLLFTGHQSRCLSCIRDAFECLRKADVCLHNEYQADFWLRGKDVTAQRGYIYHELLSDAENSKIQSVLNPEGTHAYLKSCLISIHSTQTSANPMFKVLIQRSIVALISILDKAIGYTLKTTPSLSGIVNIKPEIKLQLDICFKKNVEDLNLEGTT